MKPFALKVADVQGDTLKILGVPFFGLLNGRDTDGEYFSAKTDLCLGWYPSIPLLYHHGLDPELGRAQIGTVDLTTATKSDEGWWFQAQLDASAEYHAEIKRLIEKNVLYASSGAYPHLVERKNGELLVWPMVEISTTPTPANLLAEVKFDAEETAKHFKAAGLDFAAIKAKLDKEALNKLPDSDFAYIDKDGGRHLPIPDADHLRNALSRFDQTTFASDDDKAKAAKKILARAKALGVDVADDSPVARAAGAGKSATTIPTETKTAPVSADALTTEASYEDLISDLGDRVNAAFASPAAPWLNGRGYAYVVATFPNHCIVRFYDSDGDGDDDGYWRVAYTLDDQGEPVLGESIRVEQTYVPAKTTTPFSAAPLALSYAYAAKALGAAQARTKDVAARRVKEGRSLSMANRERLKALCEQMKAAANDLEDFLTGTDPDAKATGVADLQILDMRLRELIASRARVI